VTTLYEEAGGEDKIRAVLTSLYAQLFGDPMVGFLFQGKDKAHIVEQQVAFTCRFLGGPQRYEGKPLPEAHASLPLLPGHFDRRHHLLAQALELHNISKTVRLAWLRIDEGLRASVLSAGAEARGRTQG
jgi:hemoglobin